VIVGGSNHSHATQDLYDAIAAGDYPEWKLYIQVCHRCHSWLVMCIFRHRVYLSTGV
jgi:hypothetical protein